MRGRLTSSPDGLSSGSTGWQRPSVSKLDEPDEPGWQASGWRRPSLRHAGSAGSPVALPRTAGDLVLDLALLGARNQIVVGAGDEGADMAEPGRTHGCPRGGVGRHGLAEDPVQAEVVETVADQLAGAFAGVAMAPVSPHQPVAEVGFPGDLGLIRSVRGLQDPPADELAGGEASPEAEAGDLACGRDPPLMCMFDLGA